MGIRSNIQGNRFSEFERRANGKFTRKMDEVEAVMEEVLAKAEADGQSIIDSSGVQGTVSTGGRRGSGRMTEAFQHRVRRRGDTVIGQAGFIPGTIGREQQAIYGFQEAGTRDFHTGRDGNPEPNPTPGNRGIIPMLAVLQTEREASDALATRLRRK